MSTDYKSLSRGISRDMSSHAIARRLQIASDLYDLASFLGKARPVAKSADGALPSESSPHEAQPVPPDASPAP